jgi:hypothetical protein
MMLTLEARFPCVLCGFQLRQWSFPTARINRRSIRIAGPSIIAGPERECPECGTPTVQPAGIRYRLTAESYRARRWPETGAA